MKLKKECLFIVPLEVCDSCDLRFVAKVVTSVATLERRRRDKIRKKIASLAQDKNRSCSHGFRWLWKTLTEGSQFSYRYVLFLCGTSSALAIFIYLFIYLFICMREPSVVTWSLLERERTLGMSVCVWQPLLFSSVVVRWLRSKNYRLSTYISLLETV